MSSLHLPQRSQPHSLRNVRSHTPRDSHQQTSQPSSRHKDTLAFSLSIRPSPYSAQRTPRSSEEGTKTRSAKQTQSKRQPLLHLPLLTATATRASCQAAAYAASPHRNGCTIPTPTTGNATRSTTVVQGRQKGTGGTPCSLSRRISIETAESYYYPTKSCQHTTRTRTLTPSRNGNDATFTLASVVCFETPGARWSSKQLDGRLCTRLSSIRAR